MVQENRAGTIAQTEEKQNKGSKPELLKKKGVALKLKRSKVNLMFLEQFLLQINAHCLSTKGGCMRLPSGRVTRFSETSLIVLQ